MSQQYRFATLGEADVGKTSIAQVLRGRRYEADPCPTIGAAFNILTQQTEPGTVPLVVQLWDTAGGERYRSLVRHYTRDLDGCIVVGDLSDPGCSAKVRQWIGYLRTESNVPLSEEERRSSGSLADHPVEVWVVGNKSDLVDATEDRDLRALAEEYGFHFVRTSALDEQGVRELLAEMFDQCRQWETPNTSSQSKDSLTLTELMGDNKSPSVWSRVAKIFYCL